MPWKNQGGGPWGSGPRGPWGSGPQPVGPRPPDLEDLLLLRQLDDEGRMIRYMVARTPAIGFGEA